MSEVKKYEVLEKRIHDEGTFDESEGFVNVILHADHLATVQALEARVRELETFLEQIVTVDPDGKDLWIQTVKIRAAQYLDARKPQ